MRVKGSTIRAGLAVLAFPNVVAGAWALFVPHSWYENFPAYGRGWVTAFGAYNEHFIQDIGDAYLGFGVLLLIAALRPSASLIRGALAGYLVFTTPHFLVHLVVRESLSTAGYIGTLAPQLFAIALSVWLLVATRSDDRIATTSATG